MQDLERIEGLLVTRIAEVVDVPESEIPLDRPFAELGLSSQELVLLSGDLEQALGCSLSPTIAWEYPTIQSLAAMLAGQLQDRGPGDGDA